AEYGPLQSGRCESELDDGSREQCRGHDLDNRVAPAYQRFASAAAAAQQKVAQQRKVVAPANLPLAGRTKRAGRDDREVARQTVNTDIQKAAEYKAEHGG